MNGLHLALSFLTTIPVLSRTYIYDARHWRGAVLWFPIVGAVVGGAVWMVVVGVSYLFPPMLAAVLGVAVWVCLTGGVHLDGVADCCDALGASVDKARRLEILRDPRLGSFGVIGLILVLGLKIAALYSLIALHREWVIPAAAAMGRILILWAARAPAARPDGMGAGFANAIQLPEIVTVSLVTTAWLWFFGVQGIVAWGACVVLIITIIRIAIQKLGGVTGDVFGLLVESGELVILLVFAAQVVGGRV